MIPIEDNDRNVDVHVQLEARLKAEPETARQIDEFLANPETGVRLTRPSRGTDD